VAYSPFRCSCRQDRPAANHQGRGKGGKLLPDQRKEDVLSVFSTIGAGPGGNGQNVARMFIRLKDWELRTSGANSSFDIIDRATHEFNKINEARVIASSPPAITGLGNSSGFDMELEDHAGQGHDKLMAARDQLLQLAAANPLLSRGASQWPG
jgi:multidrug efflux pump